MLQNQAIDPCPLPYITTQPLPLPAGKLNMAPFQRARLQVCHGGVLMRMIVVVVAVVLVGAAHLLRVRGASDDGPSASAHPAGGCDLFRGRWVADKSYPLYDASTCPFVPDVFDCRRNGRPDDAYLKFRWSPANCRLPRSSSVITSCMPKCKAAVVAAQLTHFYLHVGLTAPIS